MPLTTIEITGKPLVKDCKKFGINIYNDPYYASNQGKMKAELNFEGSLYRQCLSGLSYNEDGFDSVIRIPQGSAWYDCLKGADFTIISGPAKWQKGKIKDFEDIEISVGDRSVKGSRIVFDGKLTLANGQPFSGVKAEKATERVGILVENLQRTTEGNLAGREQFSLKGNYKLLAGDIRPDGFGCNALALEGDQSSITLNTCFQRISDNNGVWHVRFWGKKLEGSGKMEIATGRYGERKMVELGTEWKQMETLLKVDKLPKGDQESAHLQFVLSPLDGSLALDDIELWKEGDTNPTVFNDDTIAAWKAMNIGILRQPRMGGDTMENFIRPAMQKYKFESSPFFKPGPEGLKEPESWGFHDILSACEYLGAEPWWSLPGTLQLEEMDLLMEYLGGDADTKGGKLRHELGHPQPWTETLKRIHIEIGNECWNTDGIYLGGGFNGSDYWRDLFARLKQSPYYRSNMVCHAAGQNYQSDMADRILKYTAGTADRYAVALYQGHAFSAEEAAFLDTDEKLFQWIFATAMNGYLGAPFRKQMEISKKHAVEFSMYEINHHLTGGNGPVEPRDKIMASIGGGMNVLNTMLGCLKHGGMRDQCIFRWQMEFNNVPNLGKVRCFGINLTTDRNRVRHRPIAQAFMLCNQAILGSLVETIHTGSNPAFKAEVPGKKGKPSENFEFSVLHSYAFADGGKRGLVLFNFDLAQAQTIELRGLNRPGKAVVRRLTAAQFTDTNELDTGEPKVKITEENSVSIENGSIFTLPSCSMLTLQWQEIL
jgi:alpha-L-arabinofuranosidase